MDVSTSRIHSGGRDTAKIEAPKPSRDKPDSRPAQSPRNTSAALLPKRLDQVKSRDGPEGESGIAEIAAQIEARTEKAARQINEYLRRTDTKLEFLVGESTGRTVIRVLDSNTGEVIRQIPPEEIVRVSEKIDELRGLLFDAEG